ncbi:ketopantoate reductase family protein [Permianibacter aggregans]|uniref:2-dehydropantoate 2-reductase n=1 Tax=Permianibacter aggregans TaxID=1510150 RepID=A0A4R6UNL8_9GAMM|nr:2-dehydropantoate 2-reductase [Permianibacter aggregans]TDQ46785.1 ketopantoate reductase [Permianibacter aggregans]
MQPAQPPFRRRGKKIRVGLSHVTVLNESVERNVIWHILGAGAQGLLWAYGLHQSHQHCRLLVRNSIPGAMATYQSGDRTVHFSVSMLTAELVQEPIEYLLVTVKANQARQALQSIRSELSDDAIVVLMQNGIGVESLARAVLPPRTRFLLGSSTHGSYRQSANHIVHAGQGQMLIGDDTGQISADHPAIQLLQQTPLNVRWHDNIQRVLWHKLAVNACANPLTALLNCRNGELRQQPVAQSWLPALIEETCAVLAAEGHPLAVSELRQKIEQVLQITAANFSSTQQDYLAGRETELAFINGTLIRCAEIHGIEVPAHREILRIVEQRGSLGAWQALSNS